MNDIETEIKPGEEAVAEEAPAEATVEETVAESPAENSSEASEKSVPRSEKAASAAKDFLSAAGKYSSVIGRTLVATLSFISSCVGLAASKIFKTSKKVLSAAWSATKTTAAKYSRLLSEKTVAVLSFIGGCAWRVLAEIVSALAHVIVSFCTAFFGTIFGWIAKKLKQPLYEVWCFIITPFAHAWGAVAHARIRLKKARKRSFFHAVGSALASFWRFLGGAGEFLRFSFNYIAPAVSIVFLISLIKYSSTLQYAISVEYNGNEIGTIENEATYNEAQSLVQDKITFTDGDQPILVTPKFTVTVLNMNNSEDQPQADIDQLSETMIETGEVAVADAYGLYINDELIGVYTEENMEVIREALNAKLDQYSSPNSLNVSFEDDIVIREGRYIESGLTGTEEALELINGSTEVQAYYKVERGDSVSKICDKFDMTEEEFYALNPGVDSVSRDELVKYRYFEPHLNVITTHYEVYDQVIERTTEYVESSRYEEYCEILLQHGSDGYENVTALVTETNGEETGRDIVSRTVLEEMVPRKFRVGTKENTHIESTKIIDTLGTFVWPLGDEDCYISSVFGYRDWDRSTHRAIDIAGIPRGTPIYAACDGTVTFSGWYADYGKLVIVDCGHGYECYYGHCSELLVSKGDKVEKGDTIAKVGMTGSASGNHLHFEMRYDGDRIDPLEALGGPGGHRYNMS